MQRSKSASSDSVLDVVLRTWSLVMRGIRSNTSDRSNIQKPKTGVTNLFQMTSGTGADQKSNAHRIPLVSRPKSHTRIITIYNIISFVVLCTIQLRILQPSQFYYPSTCDCRALRHFSVVQNLRLVDLQILVDSVL